MHFSTLRCTGDCCTAIAPPAAVAGNTVPGPHHADGCTTRPHGTAPTSHCGAGVRAVPIILLRSAATALPVAPEARRPIASAKPRDAPAPGWGPGIAPRHWRVPAV